MDIEMRGITTDDLEKIMQWRMKPSVTNYSYTDPILTMDMQKAWFQKINSASDCKYWMIMADSIDIGVLGLTDIDHNNKRCSRSWYIGEETYRGKGIAKRIQLNLYDYVFYEMKMHRMYEYILSANEHVINHINLKCGYEIEGRMKDHIYKKGKFQDVVIMGITVDKWEAIKDEFHYEKIEIEG